MMHIFIIEIDVNFKSAQISIILIILQKMIQVNLKRQTKVLSSAIAS